MLKCDLPFVETYAYWEYFYEEGLSNGVTSNFEPALRGDISTGGKNNEPTTSSAKGK
jgi:hypothetical protein